MFDFWKFQQDRQEKNTLKNVFTADKEKIKNLRIHKNYRNVIEMEYTIGIYDVWMVLNDDRSLDFLHINGNHHTEYAKEHCGKEIKEWTEYFIRNSKDRIRLLM